ncbi:MAG: cupredoxin domain-containing protein [Candidatus Levybacteria bacterium]|nr:cupredoxin domain-containing protein [Candidatus Levybacteria bacterium]MDZ4228213.1 cupredoxin domain-containing protein [Candidatus Levybacteria bacterium]
MSIDKYLVMVFSFLGIAFTYWYFLMKKDEVISVTDSVDIVVSGGYSPETISVPKGKTTKINFLRKDQSSCLEEVVLSEFKIRKYLPLNEKVSIEVTPNKEGVFPFSCGMNMFHGKIIVKG